MKTVQEIPASPSAVTLHIETLVLDGLSVRNPAHLGVVVQNELQNLIAERGLVPLGHSSAPGAHLQLATLRSPAIRTSRGSHAADVGEKIARAIYGGLRA